MRYLTTPSKRRWLFSSFVVIIIVLVMIWLGFWQLGKNNQRMAYIEGVNAEVTDTPFALTGAPADDAYAERIFHLVQAEGTFDFEHQVVIKNKFYKEAMGYHLVTPFKIKGSDRAVLVDRGWVPPEEAQSPADARRFDEPALTAIEGRIIATETSASPPAEPQFMWYRVDVSSIGRQLPYDLLPFFVALIPPDAPQTAPPYRNPPKFKLDPGTHFGNALEWFLFALLVPAFYVWQVARLDASENEDDGKRAAGS